MKNGQNEKPLGEKEFIAGFHGIGESAGFYKGRAFWRDKGDVHVATTPLFIRVMMKIVELSLLLRTV